MRISFRPDVITQALPGTVGIQFYAFSILTISAFHYLSSARTAYVPSFVDLQTHPADPAAASPDTNSTDSAQDDGRSRRLLLGSGRTIALSLSFDMKHTNLPCGAAVPLRSARGAQPMTIARAIPMYYGSTARTIAITNNNLHRVNVLLSFVRFKLGRAIVVGLDIGTKLILLAGNHQQIGGDPCHVVPQSYADAYHEALLFSRTRSCRKHGASVSTIPFEGTSSERKRGTLT